jgi:hypothetical protein
VRSLPMRVATMVSQASLAVLQRPSILMVVDIAVQDRLPHVSHLEPDPHDRRPLDVVGFREGRPPGTRANVRDQSPDPIEAAVYVVPAASAVRTSSGSATAVRGGVLGCPLSRPLSRCFPCQQLIGKD